VYLVLAHVSVEALHVPDVPEVPQNTHPVAAAHVAHVVYCEQLAAAAARVFASEMIFANAVSAAVLAFVAANAAA
jgi:hypothetical protein